MARCPQLADTAAKAHADPRTANADSPIENDMSDFLLASQNREPLQESFSDDANPLSLDGVEFIEYVTAAPQALGHVLEMMGFRPVARHRSREPAGPRSAEVDAVGARTGKTAALHGQSLRRCSRHRRGDRSRCRGGLGITH